LFKLSWSCKKWKVIGVFLLAVAIIMTISACDMGETEDVEDTFTAEVTIDGVVHEDNAEGFEVRSEAGNLEFSEEHFSESDEALKGEITDIEEDLELKIYHSSVGGAYYLEDIVKEVSSTDSEAVFEVHFEPEPIIIEDEVYYNIWQALEEVESGDVIELKTAHFPEHVGFEGQEDIKLVAAEGEEPVITENIYIENSSNITIKGLQVDSEIAEYENNGIYIEGSKEISIRDNKVMNNHYQGLFIRESSNLTIEDNLIEENEEPGIVFIDDNSNENDENLIANNTIRQNNHFGITLEELTDEVKLVDNEITGNDRHGLWARANDAAEIKGNYISQNQEDGIRINGSDVEVENNEIVENNKWGIYISPEWDDGDYKPDTESDVLLKGNEIIDNQGEHGIRAVESKIDLIDNLIIGHNETFEHDDHEYFARGVEFIESEVESIKDNVFEDNKDAALYLLRSDIEVIEDNEFIGYSDDYSFGVNPVAAKVEQIAENEFSDNRVGIYARNVYDNYEEISELNEVSGNEFRNNLAGSSFYGSEANFNNNTVEDNIIGLEVIAAVDDSSQFTDVEILDNELQNNHRAVNTNLYGEEYFTIEDNNFVAKTIEIGETFTGFPADTKLEINGEEVDLETEVRMYYRLFDEYEDHIEDIGLEVDEVLDNYVGGNDFQTDDPEWLNMKVNMPDEEEFEIGFYGDYGDF